MGVPDDVLNKQMNVDDICEDPACSSCDESAASCDGNSATDLDLYEEDALPADGKIYDQVVPNEGIYEDEGSMLGMMA